jgi:hypothetical protein
MRSSRSVCQSRPRWSHPASNSLAARSCLPTAPHESETTRWVPSGLFDLLSANGIIPAGPACMNKIL